MTSDAVTISKDEYELLLRCKHVVESEFEEGFSEEFVRQVNESEDAYKKGNFVRVKNSHERRKLFDSL
jgi:hypothetical protein